MKIQGIKEQRIQGKSSAKKKTSSSNISFSSLLEGHIPPTETVAPAQTVNFSEESPVPAQLRLDGIFMSENAIDLLESFRKGLDDLDIAENDLAPIIDALEHGSTSLLDIKEQLPKDDPLALLIDQVATISFIEAEKFRRGDYS